MSMHFVASCLQYVKWNIIYTNIILARSFINILYSFCVMADNKISMALYLLFYSCNITFFTSVNIFSAKKRCRFSNKIIICIETMCSGSRFYNKSAMFSSCWNVNVKHKTNRVLIQWCYMIVILPIMKASRRTSLKTLHIVHLFNIL